MPCGNIYFHPSALCFFLWHFYFVSFLSFRVRCTRMNATEWYLQRSVCNSRFSCSVFGSRTIEEAVYQFPTFSLPPTVRVFLFPTPLTSAKCTWNNFPCASESRASCSQLLLKTEMRRVDNGFKALVRSLKAVLTVPSFNVGFSRSKKIDWKKSNFFAFSHSKFHWSSCIKFTSSGEHSPEFQQPTFAEKTKIC